MGRGNTLMGIEEKAHSKRVDDSQCTSMRRRGGGRVREEEGTRNIRGYLKNGWLPIKSSITH